MVCFRKRAAISPLIATLLIVAIAVSMSVMLFVSTSSYLAGLVAFGAGQQPFQNQATRSLLVAENTVAKNYLTGFPTDGYIELFVRNVGGYSPLGLGSVTVSSPPTNGGLTKSFLSTLSGTTWSQPYTNVYVCSELASSASCETTSNPTLCTSQPSAYTALPIQQTAKIWIAWCSGASPKPATGDTIQVQVATIVGASTIVTITFP